MTAHKHAKIIMQYAEKAQVSETPWEYFEVYDEGWQPIYITPSFHKNYEYRLKPTTIRIGEYDVPEPLRVEPDNGAFVFMASADSVYGIIYYNRILNSTKQLFERGLLHTTKEAAILHSKALVSLTARSDV